MSAKDLGTGKEQKITITASTNLSKDDIDKAVQEAERFAEEDKKRREAIDARNSAENLVYQTEKSLTELGDKVTDEEKAPITEQIEKVKEALKGENLELVKSESEELTKRFYAIAEKLYKDVAPEGAQGAQAPATDENGNPIVDADYEVVDDDNQ